MRKVTETVSTAFLDRKLAACGNSTSTGKQYVLHGNTIAEWRGESMGELWITNAGWPTVTTRERLNALPWVSVYQRDGQQYLNGKKWSGEWTRVK